MVARPRDLAEACDIVLLLLTAAAACRVPQWIATVLSREHGVVKSPAFARDFTPRKRHGGCSWTAPEDAMLLHARSTSALCLSVLSFVFMPAIAKGHDSSAGALRAKAEAQTATAALASRHEH